MLLLNAALNYAQNVELRAVVKAVLRDVLGAAQ